MRRMIVVPTVSPDVIRFTSNRLQDLLTRRAHLNRESMLDFMLCLDPLLYALLRQNGVCSYDDLLMRQNWLDQLYLIADILNTPNLVLTVNYPGRLTITDIDCFYSVPAVVHPRYHQRPAYSASMFALPPSPLPHEYRPIAVGHASAPTRYFNQGYFFFTPDDTRGVQTRPAARYDSHPHSHPHSHSFHGHP